MSLEALLLLVGAFLTPILTFIIGWKQSRADSHRIPAQNIVDFSSAMENYGNSWNALRDALEDELERVRSQSIAREQELLSKLMLVEEKLTNARNMINEMETRESIMYKELNNRISVLEIGIDSLIKQVKSLGEDPVFTLDQKEQ